jgi:hypothetical protein
MTTLNITGDHTHDTSLSLLSGVGNTINVWGRTEMDPTVNSTMMVPGRDVINLEPMSRWVGGFTGEPYTNLYIHGGSGAVFQNTSSSVNGTAIIDANVVGTGTFVNSEAHSHGKLEFMHSVSAGQTVTTESYAFCNGVTQVDDPKDYHAANVLGFGEIILEGLKATSYSLKNDMLTLYQGNAAVYSTRLSMVPADQSSNAGRNFGVSQIAGAIDIHADGVRTGLANLVVHS